MMNKFNFPPLTKMQREIMAEFYSLPKVEVIIHKGREM